MLRERGASTKRRAERSVAALRLLDRPLARAMTSTGLLSPPTQGMSGEWRDSHIVIAGLDPAIHATIQLAHACRQNLVSSSQHGPPDQARW
jgi:hypothetical protein